MLEVGPISLDELEAAAGPEAMQNAWSRLERPPDLRDRHHVSTCETPAQRAQAAANRCLSIDSDVTLCAPTNPKTQRLNSFGAQHALNAAVYQPNDNAGAKTSSQEAEDISRQRDADRRLIESMRTRRRVPGVLGGLYSRLTSFWKKRQDLPTLESLEAVASNAFPFRMDLPVLVCDVFRDQGRITRGRLGDVEDYWKAKPKDAVLRWIHVPLGQGLLHSTIEDMFRHDWHPGRLFHHAGGTFGYLELDLVHFRDKDEVQHQRDVYRTLAPASMDGTNLRDLRVKLADRLKDACFRGKEKSLEGNKEYAIEADLSWREKHRGQVRDYWALSTSDIPMELSEFPAFHSHDGPLRPLGLDGEMDTSVLAKACKQFEGAHMLVAPFRCFHRSDNILLTMSAATGVDRLHKDFAVDLREPLCSRLTNSNASTIADMMQWLKETGAQGWRDHSIEWFLVHLVTEVAVAPTNMVSGRSASSVLSAMQGSVQALKARRFKPWKRHETVALVKEFIACIDELKLYALSVQRKLVFLEKLQTDLAEYDELKPSSVHVMNEEAGTAQSRVQWARSVLSNERSDANHLCGHADKALKALFQLGTIEQNDRAIASDVQNKAVLLFTTVTVIFLPFSVFTSYWGMNLSDMRQTEWGQAEFWKTLGAAAIIIFIAIALLSILKAQVGFKIRRNRQSGAHCSEV